MKQSDHIAHSPFELVRKILHDGCENTPLFNSVIVLYEQCCEMTVRNMERMTRGVRVARSQKLIDMVQTDSREHLG